MRAPHVPYRNSKLTYLLERSLAGNAKTLLLLHVSQEKRHVHETLQTLTFGQRARGVVDTVTPVLAASSASILTDTMSKTARLAKTKTASTEKKYSAGWKSATKISGRTGIGGASAKKK